MSKPITTPFTFQAQAGPIPLSQLDSDFATAAAAINDFATYSNYLTDTSGAPNQITVTIPVGTTFSYSAGVKLEVLLGNTTTSTAVQINVNGLGNKAVQNIDGSVPAVGQLIAGMILQLHYNGTVFLLTGAASKPGSIAPFTATVGGNVSLPAPSSGAAFTTTQIAGSSAIIANQVSTAQPAIAINSANGISAAIQLNQTSVAAWNMYVLGGSGSLRWTDQAADRMTLTLGGGLQIGAPTGGDQGVGALNATGLFVNGVSVGGGRISAHKNTTTTVASTTLSSDPSLTLSLPIGTFAITAFILMVGGAGNSGYRYAFATTGTMAGGTGQTGSIAGATVPPPQGFTTLGSVVSFASSTSGVVVDYLLISGFATVTVAGTITFQFASNGGTPSVTSQIGSWIKAEAV